MVYFALPVDACSYQYGTPESAVTNIIAASHLVNGRGRFENNTAPLEIHKVEQGREYMFRITNAGFNDVFEVRSIYIIYEVFTSRSQDLWPIVVSGA